MGDVRLIVGTRQYDVSCADGDEEHLLGLAQIVDEKAHQARMVVGDANETRQLLFAAIFLADELKNTQTSTPPESHGTNDTSEKIKALVERIDRLTDTLLAER